MIEDYIAWRSILADVLDTRFYTLDWLDEQVFNGDAKVWSSDRAIILAELRHYPAGAVEVHGMVAAGDLEAVVDLIPFAERWGISEGALTASIASRPGWAKALKAKGYAVHQVELRKELF